MTVKDPTLTGQTTWAKEKENKPDDQGDSEGF
jgi:hypothetical protein